MKTMITILFYVFMLSACCKVNYIDPPAVNNPSDDSIPYKLIWETPLFDDTLGSYAVQFLPQIIGDYVIYASNDNGWGPGERKDYVKAYDLKTGKVQWTWSGYKLERKTQRYDPQKYGDILVVSSGEEIYGLDSKTGTQLFERVTVGYRSVIQVSKGILFYSEEFYPDGDSSSIFMYNNVNDTWREIFKVHKQEYDYVCLYPPEVEFTPENDTILYFQKRKSLDKGPYSNADLYCYNLTKDTVVWQVVTVDSLVSNIGNPPLVDDSRVYFLSAKRFHCYDKQTGKKLWERYFSNTNFLSAGYGLYKDVVYVVADNGDLIAVYKSSGTVKYHKFGHFSQPLFLAPIYKNYLLTCWDSVVITDMETADHLHILKSHRFNPGQFNTGVAVDERTGFMYVSDGYFLECIEFPE